LLEVPFLRSVGLEIGANPRAAEAPDYESGVRGSPVGRAISPILNQFDIYRR
jgi:hypothetical protein